MRSNIITTGVLTTVLYFCFYSALPMFGDAIQKRYMIQLFDTVNHQVLNSDNFSSFQNRPISELVDPQNKPLQYLSQFISYEIIKTDTTELEWIYFISTTNDNYYNTQDLCIDSRGTQRWFQRSSDAYILSECLDGDSAGYYTFITDSISE